MKRYLLLLILIFSALVRLWHITSLPPSLFSDEVDLAYQAKTFSSNYTDYFGNKFPIHFKSFSDYRTSLEIYSTWIIQHFTSNDELSVRLPPVIFSLISIFILYKITNSIIPSVLMAISPWSIHYSRTGFEVSGMLMCLLLGLYYWQTYTNSHKQEYLYLSVLFYCLSPYFYSTAKLFIIFIPLITFFTQRQYVLQISPKKILIVIIFGIILLSPMMFDTLAGRSGFRFSYISIITKPGREQVTDNLRYQDALIDHYGEVGVPTSILSKIEHNKIQLMFQEFITNYVSSFSSDFLLIKGDLNSRHGFNGYGLIYILDAILMAIGIFYTFTKHKDNKLSKFMFCWLLLAPVPYALTRDSVSPHATRLILVLPSIIYFAYLGIIYITRLRKLYFIVILLYILSFLNFWHYYNYHYPQESARGWHTGMKETIIATNNYPNQPLIFSNAYEPFMPFFLLYHPYHLSFSTSINDHLQKVFNSSFDGQLLDNKYYFGMINWSNLASLPSNAIYIVSKSEFITISAKYKVIKLIFKTYINQEEFYLLSF